MESKVALQITILLLLLLLPENAIFWPRRRRRRPPPRPPPSQYYDCRVSSWTSWSSCSYRCGSSGTQWRTRRITRATSHGRSCFYHLSESQWCNRGNCWNGGTPHNTGCTCRAGDSGTCCSRGKKQQFVFPTLPRGKIVIEPL